MNIHKKQFSRRIRMYFASLFFIMMATLLNGQALFINEFMAANTTIPDEAGEFDDWIEIYNGGSSAIDINGYFMSDDVNNPLAFQIDTSVVIEPGEFILLWADKDEEQGKFHLGFKLGAGGEQISLMSPLGVYVDSLTYGEQTGDVSYGRFPDGSSDFFFFQTPTPEEPNAGDGNIGEVDGPVFSINGGFYPSSINVSLTSTTPDADIYYTLDGTDPDESSSLYTGAISISETSTLRAKSFRENYFPSSIISHTYYINESYTLPVMSIVTDPDNMFDPDDGIYANPTEGGSDWERYCQVQYFKNDNLDFSIDCGIRIQGSSSVTLPKKSFRLFFDNDYGQSRLEYPMFEGSDVDEFKNLVLRAGYDDDITDEDGTLLRDPLGNRQYKETGGLITEGNWAILTINGEYWGVYEIRESLNPEFIESHTGWDNFDMVRFDKSEPELKNGTWDDWDFMRDFLENNDMSDETNYAQAQELIDMDNLINLQALIQCSSYRSWSYGVATFKESVPGGKWKYTVWDMDRSHSSTWWNPHDDYPADGSLTWGNFLNNSLTENETFRNKLVNRVADLLNSNYRPDNIISYLDDMRLEIDAEMEGEYDRWNPDEDINTWYVNLDGFNELLEDRPRILRGFIVEHYNFPDTNRINLNVVGQGTIKFNTLDISEFPWSGVYFEDVPVPVSAIAAPGYVFSGWSDTGLPNVPNVEVSWSDLKNLTAFFIQGSTEIADVVINEINYNSSSINDSGDWIELYNPTSSDVDISGWTFKDSGTDYFNLPANTILEANEYLLLVEDSIKFQMVYPGVTPFIGAFGDSPFGDFKLSNDGEFISISNANSSYRDTVLFNDVLPWPLSADGAGPTLQLISPDLDNALALSWQAMDATPASLNNVTAAQVIDFPSIEDQFTTNLPFALEATSTSGLQIVYSIISGPATVDGNIISLNGTVGEVVVQADQPGNGSFLPAPGEQQSFVVTKQNQTITFGAIADKVTTDIPFSISAITSSGLAVNFTIVSGPASISGSTISLDGIAGTVVVEASQSGNDDYFAAASVQQSFTVGQQNQTITFGAIADKVTTDIPFSISASTSSGLAVSFTIVSGPASISGSTISLDGIAGTVVVEASQSGNDDYFAAASVQQSFTVGQQNQTITFGAIADKVTTDIPFSISASTSSGLAVSFTIVSGPASISGSTISLDGIAGTVVVEASQSGNDDYFAAASVQQSFEVTRQSQLIDFTDIPNKFTSDPDFEISASSNVGLSVSFSIISGPATISGNTISLTGQEGIVIVQADQAGNQIYLPANSVQKSFAVSEEILLDQTIEFNSLSNKLTTDLPFALSASASSDLSVSFSIVSGPASISGNMVTLDGVAGTVVLQADQIGNADYYPAQSVQQSFEVLQQSQTISFGSISDQLTTATPFAISASASSGLSINFEIISGPASIFGDVITLNGVAGTVVVQANQIGDDDYLPAQSVQQSFEVLQQSQAINFGSISDQLTTATPFVISASASSGLPVNFSIISGPASVLGNTVTLSGLSGTVVVEASQGGSDDYLAALNVQQSFEVVAQSQTISFENLVDKLTTDDPFEVMASASSGLTVDFEIVSGPATVDGTIITLDGVAGTVVVQANQSGDNDYLAAQSMQQSFEVLQQSQTISFDVLADKLTTDLPFDLMANSSSGLAVSFEIASGPASINGSTITLDGVAGTVVVEAVQAGNNDYSAAATIQQSFDVQLTSQTISFDDIPDKMTTDVPFEIVANSSVGLTVEFNIVSGPASVSGNTITLDGMAGIVVVEASQGGGLTYAAADNVNQSFEVILVDAVENLEDGRPAIIAFPNPVRDQLSLKINANLVAPYDLMIYDKLGRLRIKAKIENLSEIQEIAVADLRAGVYTLSIRQEKATYIVRFVKLD